MRETFPHVVLEVRNLVLSFDSKSLIKGMNVSLVQGEKIALVGKSGSGKSSLLKCLLGVLLPSAGEIVMHGEELTLKTVWALRRRIGYVPQEPELGELTGEEYIRRPFQYKANRHLTWSPERLQELCQAFHLEPSLLGQPSRLLSGGEKQRIALIAALMLERELYLLDEITSALDEESRAAVADFFRSQAKLTAVLVAHDPELRAICDRTYLLGPEGPWSAAS
jgi:ABC-type multidrug transport system ATPase subunit